MKTLLFLLVAASFAFAQMPDPNATPAPKSADVLEAEALAKEFIDTCFGKKDYRAAEKLMNPDSPARGKLNPAEFRKQRIESLKRVVEEMNERFGNSATWRISRVEKFRKMADRDQDEEFLTIAFMASFTDGRESGASPIIVKKKGRFFIDSI